jgi:hypothetical protein
MRNILKLKVLTGILVFLIYFHSGVFAAVNYEEVKPCTVLLPSGPKWGFVKATTGQWVVQPQYDAIGMFEENGLAAVKIDNKWGFIDLDGKQAIPLRFERVSRWAEGLAAVQENGNPGYIDVTGRMVIGPLPYKICSVFSEGLATIIDKQDKAGYIDKAGKVVIEAQYESADSFSEGLAAVRINGKVGFINKKNEVVIEPQYATPSSFKEGFASVDGRGYIDKVGRKVISAQTLRIWQEFSEDRAAVVVDKK